MKFKKKEYDSLGVKTVEYFESDNKGAFCLKATKFGVKIMGESPMFEGDSDLQIFAKALSDAWTSHRKLQPQIVIAQSVSEERTPLSTGS